MSQPKAVKTGVSIRRPWGTGQPNATYTGVFLFVFVLVHQNFYVSTFVFYVCGGKFSEDKSC